MRAKTVNEWESGYYPPGAEHDPNAPWNQNDDTKKLIDFNEWGDLELVYRTTAGPEEWEDEKETIDAETFDRFLAKKLELDYDEMIEADEEIEIIGLNNLKNNFYEFITSHGDVKTSFSELKGLV